MKASQLALLALVAAGFSVPVLAQTTNVTVGVTLTAKCEFTSSALTFSPAYTPFQAAALTPTTQTANIRCTRGATAPTFAWDTGGGTAAGIGVVRGLVYQLSATLGTVAGGTAPAGTLLTDLGTPATAPVTIGLTVPGGQAGASTGSDVTRVLTVSF